MVTSLTNQSKLGAALTDEIVNGYDLLAAMPTLSETGGSLLTDGASRT